MLTKDLLGEEQVVLILTSADSNTRLAARLGVSQQAISDVRRGNTHQAIRIDLPRYTEHRRRRFSPKEIAAIRASKDSYGQLAARYNVSRGAIADIRLGRTYRDLIYVNTDRALQHCHKCQHWKEYCRLGFPEAELDPAFAAECHLYAT